jgi:hypothetical protein
MGFPRAPTPIANMQASARSEPHLLEYQPDRHGRPEESGIQDRYKKACQAHAPYLTHDLEEWDREAEPIAAIVPALHDKLHQEVCRRLPRGRGPMFERSIVS